MKWRSSAAALLAVVAMAASAAPAFATFHEISIREVYPGSTAAPDSEYVELQMWSAGQHLVDGHSIAVYRANGSLAGSAALAGDVASGTNQSTVLLATPVAASEFGVAVDAGMDPNLIDPGGGAVCWESLDCVSWGAFGGSLPSPAGSPASPAGIPDGMALRRTIAPGCSSLLEAGDDRDNGVADFTAVFPAPRPNSFNPAERPCAAAGPQLPGSAAQGPRRSPRTMLRRTPARKARDRTPTFGFASNEAGAAFQCSLDSRPFRRCRSPLTTRKLAIGRHIFRVRARGRGGALDPSPASYSFRIVA